MAKVVSVRWYIFPRFGAAMLLLSITIATMFSAAHQDNIGVYHPSSGHDLIATHSNDVGRIADIKTMEVDSCATGVLCHVQLVLISEAGLIDAAHFPSNSLRPDPGVLLAGQTVDVVIPPPLLVRA